MLPYSTLSNIRYVSRVKWSNPTKGVTPSPTPRCSSYWKGRLLVTLDCGRQLYLLSSLNVQDVKHCRAEFNRFKFKVFLPLNWVPYHGWRTQAAHLFAGGRIIGFIPILRVLALSVMQTVSSKIWTCVTVFISLDGNHFTTNIDILYMYIYIHKISGIVKRLVTFWFWISALTMTTQQKKQAALPRDRRGIVSSPNSNVYR